MSAVAIIPARGGSKRIPQKNIVPFCGHPMISWPIRTAIETGLFDRIVVSTDCEEIADVACQFGAEAPFRRPAELADDHTGTVPVIRHAIQTLHLPETTQVCALYPTAVFITSADLKALADGLDDGACFCFPVLAYAYPPQRALTLDAGEHPSMVYPEHAATRSQDLTPQYHDAGQCYWASAQTWHEPVDVFAPTSRAICLPRGRFEDIDTPDDLARAQWLFEYLREKRHDRS